MILLEELETQPACGIYAAQKLDIKGTGYVYCNPSLKRSTCIARLTSL